MVKVKKKPTVSSLKKKADQVFSTWVRLSNAAFDGTVACVTCGAVKPWKEQQAGHYERRSKNGLRYSETNVHVQCVGCNVFQHGNYPRYAQFMVKTYGQSILSELEEEAKKLHKFTVQELEGIIAEYKAKIAGLT